MPGGVWTAYAASAFGAVVLCAAAGQMGFIGAASLSFFGWTFHSGRFILVYAGIWAACLAMLLFFPRKLPRHRRWWAVFIPALACRLFLLPLAPSDDVNRYLWEGRLVQMDINPYHHAPDDPALSNLAAGDPFHGGINHPDIPAIYPPLMLMGFSALIRLGYDPMVIKCAVTLFDLGAVLLLMGLLGRRRLGERWALLYAVNPVVLVAFAGQGHLDAVQIFFLLAAIRLYDRRRWGWMFLAAGLAVQVKYVAVLVLPFLVRRDNLRWLWAAAPAVLLPFLPFAGEDPGRIFEALKVFGTQFAFNGSVHGLLRRLLGGIPPATAVCHSFLAASMLFGWFAFHPTWSRRCRNDPVPGCCYAMGALLLLSPTVHSWYLAWIIPFLALRPSASWMVLCLTISLVFMAEGHLYFTGRWRLPPGVTLAVWLPFWLLFSVDLRRGISRLRAPLDHRPPESVSVVIPARNEGAGAGACVRAVLRDRHVMEAIVVDGGSIDDTPLQAAQAGARVIRHDAPPGAGGGRGGQIRAGVAAAAGDVVAVVHADTRVAAGEFGRMLALLQRQPMIVGGALGGRFQGRGIPLRLLEAANDFRAAFLGISFGDQVQFFRRRPVAAAGLYPDIPLMEDVELSLRLQHLGRTAFLFGEAEISARRWRSGVPQRAGLIIRLFASYLWQRLFGPPDTLAMYRRYYGGGR